MLLQRTLLPFDPAPTEDMCRELDRWRDALDTKGPFLRIWQGRLRRDLEAEAVAASTSMEGVPVTVEEVRRILAGDRPAEVRESDARLVEGYRDAMGFVLRRADDAGFRWDPELVIGLHDRVMAGDYGAGAGRFRTTIRRVANSQTGRIAFEPPDASDVPALVEEMCQIMSGDFPHPAVAAAWIHVATAAIHPFGDGNGRAARVLASLAMFRGGFRIQEFTSLEEWWGRHLAEYYAAFECLGSRFSREADVTPFVVSHVHAQLSQVRALDMRERVLRRVFAAILGILDAAGLPERLTNPVYDAFFGSAVTPAYYRSVADVSPPTVTTDLSKAVAAGLLRAEGETRGRRYRAASALFQRVAGYLNIASVDEGETARAVILSELASRLSAADAERSALSNLSSTAPPTIGAVTSGVTTAGVGGTAYSGFVSISTGDTPPDAGSPLATLIFGLSFQEPPQVRLRPITPGADALELMAPTEVSVTIRASRQLQPRTTYQAVYEVERPTPR